MVELDENVELNVDASNEDKPDADYSAKDLQVLEGLEAVRKRPGMYIGTTASAGLHHLVWEIVDNSIDEALAGFCDRIIVTINKGDTITVDDNGRGVPVDIVEKSGLSGVETVFTILHAGGKFGETGGYKVSGGLHGVGASVVNALSEWCEVYVTSGNELTVKADKLTKEHPDFKAGRTGDIILRSQDQEFIVHVEQK